jgi:hypothetical protein
MAAREVQQFEIDLDHLMTAKEGDVMPIQGKVAVAIEECSLAFLPKILIGLFPGLLTAITHTDTLFTH